LPKSQTQTVSASITEIYWWSTEATAVDLTGLVLLQMKVSVLYQETKACRTVSSRLA